MVMLSKIFSVSVGLVIKCVIEIFSNVMKWVD